MCGIAGLYFSGCRLGDREEGLHLVREMIGRLTHRGPDAGGVWSDKGGRCVLGHRRLSIIDASDSGRQPMVSANGRWVISFNGEIYNFKELREALNSRGRSFDQGGDTKVLLECISLWGKSALGRFDGMFSFAAFDIESGEMLIARDPFGEKPLYYMDLERGGVAFASELQALEIVPCFDSDVSCDAMAELLMFQYIGAPRTIYSRVKKLPPGHYMRLFPDGRHEVRRYFEFVPGRDGFDDSPIDTLVDELEDILTRSIRRRMISDVPLGAFLSGGVDSSVVCALIRKNIGLPIKTFSIGFRNSPESEHDVARAFANRIGSEHFDRIITPNSCDFLSGIGRILDEPNGDSSCFPTYVLSEFARQRVTVAISGDGGDEMFLGYGRYFHTLDEEKERSLYHGGFHPGNAYYSNRILVYMEDHIDKLFGHVPEVLRSHVGRLRDEVACSGGGLYCKMRKTDVENYLPGAVLSKVDRMSMQHSLEVRTPFLNVDLARFAERLPLSHLYDGERGKLLLRRLAYRYLPRELIDQPKRGFGIPMSRWGKGALLKVASDFLESEDSRLRHVFGDAMDTFLARQRSPNGFSTYQVWSLVVLESWLRHHPASLENARASVLEARSKPRTVLSSARDGRERHCLIAWPVGEKTFVVTEGMRPDVLDDVRDSPNSMNGGPFVLPNWGQYSEDVANSHVLSNAKIIFSSDVSIDKIDRYEVEKLRDMGVSQIEYPHPHRPNGTYVRIGIRKRKHGLQAIISYMSLCRSSVFNIGMLYNIRVLLSLLRKRRSCDFVSGNRLSRGPIENIVCEPDTEMSFKYMLFQGMKQLPPIPVMHSEILEKGNGRYSVWNGILYFSPTRFRRLIFNRFMLVERNDKTEPHLQYTCDIVTPDDDGFREFLAAIERKIEADAPGQGGSLEPRKGPIVVFTHGLPPGGAERQWCYLASGMKEYMNEEVIFVTMNSLEGGNAHYRYLIDRAGIDVYELSKLPVPSILEADCIPEGIHSLLLHDKTPWPSEDVVRMLLLLDRIRPRAIIAQLDSPNLFAAAAGILAGVPRIILSFRNYNPSHFPYLHNDWFKKYYEVISRSEKVSFTGNSRDANSDYSKWIGIDDDRVTFIPNCIDGNTDMTSRDLGDLRKELSLAEDTPVILGVFRLSEEKRPYLFVDVCRKIREKMERLSVLMAGSGPMEDDLRHYIEHCGMSDSIRLLGRRDDVFHLMAVADLLLLVSSREGMPNVLMEAQYIGLPIVASRVGGVPDVVVDGEGGFLVDSDEPEAYAEKALTILTRKEVAEEMRTSAIDRMKGHFSKRSMVEKYMQLV